MLCHLTQDQCLIRLDHRNSIARMNTACSHKDLLEEQPLQRIKGRRSNHGARSRPAHRTSSQRDFHIRKARQFHPDIHRAGHDRNSLAMAQVSCNLSGRRPRGQRNRFPSRTMTAAADAILRFSSSRRQIAPRAMKTPRRTETACSITFAQPRRLPACG